MIERDCIKLYQNELRLLEYNLKRHATLKISAQKSVSKILSDYIKPN